MIHHIMGFVFTTFFIAEKIIDGGLSSAATLHRAIPVEARYLPVPLANYADSRIRVK